MNDYIYIVCAIVDEEGAIGFAHALVSAKDEDAAYYQGGRLLDKGALVNYVAGMRPLNDYVLALGSTTRLANAL